MENDEQVRVFNEALANHVVESIRSTQVACNSHIECETINNKAMITKTITPIIRTHKTTTEVVGTSIEYRIFGMLVYRVKLITPRWYQIGENEFIYRI